MSKNETNGANGASHGESENELAHHVESDAVKKPDDEIEEAYGPLKEAAYALAKRWVACLRALEIILFGRFMASSSVPHGFNVEGAVCVAHSISTNAFEPEDDFFSALDDLTDKSVHLGSNNFGSGTMFKCWISDARMAHERIKKAVSDTPGSVASTQAGFEYLIDCVMDASPGGRKNSFANFTASPIVVAMVQSMPMNLVTAFEKPVSANGSDYTLTELSAMRLDREWTTIRSFYGEKYAHRIEPHRIGVFGLGENAAEIMPTLSKHACKTREEFISAVTHGLDKLIDSNPTTPFFINLFVLVSEAPSCPNRNDVGERKTAIYGSVVRARNSSASEKRPVRQLMRERYTNNGVHGILTKEAVNAVMTKLEMDPTDVPVRKAVEYFVAGTGANVGVTDPLDPEAHLDGRTDALVFYGSNEIESMSKDLRNGWDALKPFIEKARVATDAIKVKREEEHAAIAAAKSEKTAKAKAVKPAKIKAKAST